MTARALPILPASPVGAAGSAAPPAHGWPLLRLGFRPFYLGAAVFAALAVPVWVAATLGLIQLPAPQPPLHRQIPTAHV